MERPSVRCRLNGNTVIVPANLQSLPPELQHNILKQICENGFADFWRVKSTCKALCQVSDTPDFHREINILMMKTLDFPDDGVKRFKNLCLYHGSPSAAFTKGCYEFFKQGNLEGGLEGIRLSVVGGYDLGCYAYALIHRILNLQVAILNGMSLVSKAFVLRMRVEVYFLPDIVWPMFDHRPPLYDKVVNLIPVEDVYACRCSPNRRWPRAWFEECKQGPMCERCFWICHASWFSREFPKKVLTWPDQHYKMNPQIAM